MGKNRNPYKLTTFATAILCIILFSTLIYTIFTNPSTISNNDNSQIDSYISQLASMQVQLDGNVSELNTLNQQITVLTSESSNLKNQITELKNQIETKNSQIANLTTQLNTEKTTITNLESQLNNLKSQLAKKESQLSEKTSQLAEAESQICDLKNSIEEKISQISNLTGQISNLNSQISFLNSRIDDLYSQIVSKNYQISNLKTSILDSMTKMLLAKDTTVLFDNLTLCLPLGKSFNHTFSAQKIGYLSLEFQTNELPKDYSSVQSGIRMEYDGEIKSQGALVDVEGTAYFPIMPSNNINLTISGLTRPINKNVTITYHYYSGY